MYKRQPPGHTQHIRAPRQEVLQGRHIRALESPLQLAQLRDPKRDRALKTVLVIRIQPDTLVEKLIPCLLYTSILIKIRLGKPYRLRLLSCRAEDHPLIEKPYRRRPAVLVAPGAESPQLRRGSIRQPRQHRGGSRISRRGRGDPRRAVKFAARGDKRNIPAVHVAAAVRHHLRERRAADTKTRRPVSYTHLDVYKRQV